ncbi:MAG: carboxypeptidase-like regulatory domain-containing protein [Flavisolibacter sp.]|nr:carboxypeptidase-like regulatory domain-containing protein [Flavisolibacter sp.]
MENCLPKGKNSSFPNGLVRNPFKSLRFLCLIVFSLFSSVLFAQQTVTGRVMSGDTAVVGATVQVKGTSTATQTDTGGNFTISAPANATLVISYVGYNSQEVKVGNRSTINVQLQSSAQQLGEVVVVGYGTQRRVNLTGSVATVSGAELNKRVVTNPASLLQGKAPGLTVVQNSDEPGGEAGLIIRDEDLCLIRLIPTGTGIAA